MAINFKKKLEDQQITYKQIVSNIDQLLTAKVRLEGAMEVTQSYIKECGENCCDESCCKDEKKKKK
tara:strand:- start:20646 stop:20843 length:198 start_codon:yes stop_codon:yes gene_type:complete